MADFRYTAMNTAGARVSGVVSGASEQAALAELERRSLTPIQLAGQKGGAGAAASKGPRVGQARLATAYSQVADLVRSGVPLLRALRLIGRRKSAPKLAAVFDGLASEVEDGRTLADAMADVPSVFKPVHVAMVRAGEAGGFLEQALAQLGGLVRNQVELRQKVVGSLIYPAAIVCVGLAVLTILFAFFIPMFSETYEDVQLGTISQLVFGISGFVRSYGIVLIVLAVAGGVGLRYAWKRDDVRVKLVEGASRLPVVGPLLRSLAVARVCRMLGTLMGSGVGMLQALNIARDAAGLPRMSAAVESAIEAVRAGEPLSGPLRESGLFPDDVIEMIDVAESANTLEPTLVTIAESVEQRTDRQLTIAVRLIEPMVIVAIAVCVVFVAAGLILPMLQFGQMTG